MNLVIFYCQPEAFAATARGRDGERQHREWLNRRPQLTTWTDADVKSMYRKIYPRIRKAQQLMTHARTPPC